MCADSRVKSSNLKANVVPMCFSARRFTLAAQNLYTTKKGQAAGYGNHGISNEGVIEYRALLARWKVMLKKDRKRYKKAWKEYTEWRGLDVDWKDKRKRKVSLDEIDTGGSQQEC